METSPSQVLTMLRAFFADDFLNSGQSSKLVGSNHLPRLQVLVEHLEAIPERLMPTQEAERHKFLIVRGVIRAAAQRVGDPQNALTVFGVGNKKDNALLQLSELLKSMPDQAAEPQDPRLRFISDAPRRADLLADWDSAGRLLNAGEWKAATVLSGAVIEALLLYGLEATAAREGRASHDYAGMTLGPMINAACGWDRKGTPTVEHGQLIGEDQALAAILRGPVLTYRNLIHPGRQRRSGMSMGLGTAPIVFGAVERVALKLAESLEAAGTDPQAV